MTNYVFLAPGFEEIEAVAPVDVMRRAGMNVTTVSILPGNPVVEGAHGVKYVADTTIDAVADCDGWLILPGGMPGATNLVDCQALVDMLMNHRGNIAAICASPSVVLGSLGLLNGERATCYPGMEDGCKGASMTGEGVTRSGRFITGQGPARAVAFGLAIVGESLGEDVASQVADAMLVKK